MTLVSLVPDTQTKHLAAGRDLVSTMAERMLSLRKFGGRDWSLLIGCVSRQILHK